MKAFRVALSLLVGFSPALSRAATNLLNNPSFEDPAQSGVGNHLNVNVTGWVGPDGATTKNNLVIGGASYTGGPTSAFEGNQYFDIDSGGDPSDFAYQLVTITQTDTYHFGGWFSRRDNDSGSGHIEIWSWSGGSPGSLIEASAPAVIASSESINVWRESASLVNLTAGTTYQFRVQLTNPTNADAVYLSNVPEPTTAIAGLLLSAGLLIRRRA